MKKALFLLLVGLSAAGAALAGPPPPAANVNFASERGVPFAVVLDGRPLTRGLARQVHVEQLAPGLHYADFSVPTPYGGAVRLRSRVWLEPGLETTFVLLARPGRPLDLQPAGAVALYGPNCGRPGYDNRNGGYDNRRSDDRRDRDHDYDHDGRGGYGRNGSYPNGVAYPPDAYGTRPSQQADPAYNQGGAYGQPGGYDPNSGYYANRAAGGYPLLAASEVDGLAQALSQCSFEPERLQLARQALTQSAIRADDLARLLQGFQFDDSRVELAEFAYPHVADRQNFYRVYPAFEFRMHAREVQDAVARM